MSKFGDFFKEANLIGGDWIAAETDACLAVTNPANGNAVGIVPNAGESETRAAIESADKAFHSFSKTTVLPHFM